MTKELQVQLLSDPRGGIASIQMLLAQGISYYDINRLLADEKLIKLKRGVYKWADCEVNELVEVAFMIPNGVFCLQTACFYHELTTSIPSKIHIVLLDDRRVALPDYPPIQLYHWKQTAFHLGKTTVLVDNEPILMYDLEKTICDVIRHRQKLGFEMLKEVLKNYLQRPDRNLNRLNHYAKQLKIYNKIDQFIKILL
jgi:predicted transcriptional regulator of viral defense system